MANKGVKVKGKIVASPAVQVADIQPDTLIFQNMDNVQPQAYVHSSFAALDQLVLEKENVFKH
jgi:hypothetical protein